KNAKLFLAAKFKMVESFANHIELLSFVGEFGGILLAQVKVRLGISTQTQSKEAFLIQAFQHLIENMKVAFVFALEDHTRLLKKVYIDVAASRSAKIIK